MHDYIVQIPLRSNRIAGINSSSGDGLPVGYIFHDIFHIKSEGSPIPIWWLGTCTQAADRTAAIQNVLPYAYRFIQFVALTYDRGFEIDVAGSKADRLDGSNEASGSLHGTASPVNLDEMTLLWDQFDKIDTSDEQGQMRKNLIQQGLDWIYIGKTMRDSSNTLLAYVTALEILFGSRKGNTVFMKAIPEERTREKLTQQIDATLSPYIEDNKLRARVIARMRDTETEGKTAAWQTILNKAGVVTTKKELDDIYSARSGTTHTGGRGSDPLLIKRAYEITTSYIKTLLSQEGEHI